VGLFSLRGEGATRGGKTPPPRRCGTGDRGAAVLWPDQAIRGHVARAGPTALRRRRGGYRRTRTRGRPHRAKEKKPLRTEGRHCMSRPRPHSARMADRVASTETPPQCDRALQRPLWSRVGGDQRPAPPTTTLETTNGEGSALIGQRRQHEAVSRRRQCLVRRRARGREHHARPSRGCHDDRARNCHCLSPTVGGYADVREAQRGMISRDGGRHYEEERDHCANKGRAQRREGDLPKDEGDAAGN
jgi:hypothetical protein